jgi:hypothetical protein
MTKVKRTTRDKILDMFWPLLWLLAVALAVIFAGRLLIKAYPQRAIILLEMDWHCTANRALLLELGAVEACFWAVPCRLVYPSGAEVVRRMASRKSQEAPDDPDKIQT